jgi:hypothetical protein
LFPTLENAFDPVFVEPAVEYVSRLPVESEFKTRPGMTTGDASDLVYTSVMPA